MSPRRPPLAMRPRGVTGRVFGYLMEAINTPAYRFALDLLELGATDDVLEIGFGTGAMIALMLGRTKGRVAGVDPTPTMVAWARSRAAVRGAADRVTLSLGGDAEVFGPPASFARIVALHSFQFWSDPEETLGRLSRLLRPDGRLVLVLRDHSHGTADWLPNPLSRGPGEVESTRALIEKVGLQARVERRARMVGLVGDVR